MLKHYVDINISKPDLLDIVHAILNTFQAHWIFYVKIERSKRQNKQLCKNFKYFFSIKCLYSFKFIPERYMPIAPYGAFSTSL